VVDHILQSIFRPASRRETLAEQPRGDRRQGGLKCVGLNRAQRVALCALLRTARGFLVIAQRLDLRADQMISIRQVEVAAERWVHHQQRRNRIRGLRGSREWFIHRNCPELASVLGSLRSARQRAAPFCRSGRTLRCLHARAARFCEAIIRHRRSRAQKLGYFFDTGRHRGHGLHFLTGAGASTFGVLTVEVGQAELEGFFEREGAGEPDSYSPGVSGDHRADLKQLEPDGVHLSTSQFRGFEAKPAQCLQ
jgi:hypothetical protein